MRGSTAVAERLGELHYLRLLNRFVGDISYAVAEAGGNAVIETWSNGQTEGQINRLKTLKRAMFGRARIELLRARLMPVGELLHHQMCG